MVSGFIDRVRAMRLMEAEGLDALVLCAPSAFTYATGGSPGVAALLGRAGACFALVPADPARTVAAVIGDLEGKPFRAASGLVDVRSHPLWIETGQLGQGVGVAAAIEAGWGDRAHGFARPATFDLKLAANALRDLLTAGISGRPASGWTSPGCRRGTAMPCRRCWHPRGSATGPTCSTA